MNKPVNQDQQMALVGSFLENQKKELAIRAQELELNKQQDANSHKFATAALDAQKSDRESERTHQLKTRGYAITLSGIALISLLLFLGYCISLGHAEIPMEIIKSIVMIFGGGAGGYAIGKNKSSNGNGQQ